MKWKHGVIAAAGVGAGLAAAGGVAAGMAAWSLMKRRHEWLPSWTSLGGASLRGQAVFITGGSRGLGLALAREFAAEGCLLTICARNADELNRAAAGLRALGAEVEAIPCDITDREQAQSAIQTAARRYGRIDVLVNNAGQIQVGPLEHMTIQDFENAMNLMFWGGLHMTLAALPAMRQRRSGRIVNITSIGGKISVPHLLPYSCAKFAAVALSEGLRTELAPAGIEVTTIVPGLMRTGSHVQALFRGDHEKEFAWFSLGAATPLVSIGAERAARAIVRAVKRGSAERILSVPANIAARLHGAFPELTAPVLALVNRLLPAPVGGNPDLMLGLDIERNVNSRLFRAATAMGRSAAERWNELPVES